MILSKSCCPYWSPAISSSMVATQIIEDSIRRTAYLESKGLYFIGTGISGGEEGARHGPSIMPGGSPASLAAREADFSGIAAKVEDGSPCCDWVGRERRRPFRQDGA